MRVATDGALVSVAMVTEKRHTDLSGVSPIKYARRETRVKKSQKLNVERTTTIKRRR
jgi:hypothetical protein